MILTTLLDRLQVTGGGVDETVQNLDSSGFFVEYILFFVLFLYCANMPKWEKNSIRISSEYKVSEVIKPR